MPMIDGAMQPYALTLDKFLQHAAKWHPHAEVVTRARAGGVVAHWLRGAVPAQPQGVTVLEGFGVRAGDRVATLAWNTQAHVEV